MSDSEPHSRSTKVGASPPATSDHARRTMQANRRRDTSPEIAVRQHLHRRGLRYRVDFRLSPPLRTRADIVFPKKRLAIFIDGCFWHSCPIHGTTPKRNSEYWIPKLERNAERDRETDRALVALGWRVFHFWEHEDPLAVAQVIEKAVNSPSEVTVPGIQTL